MWEITYLYLLCAHLYWGRLAGGTEAPTSGLTGESGWADWPLVVAVKHHAVLSLGRVCSSCRVAWQSYIQCAVTRCYSSKSLSDEGITASLGEGITTAGWTSAGGGAVTYKYLTLESMAFSLHARFSSSRRRLRPAVPPIDLHCLLVDTGAATQFAGTRTFGLEREARKIVSWHIQCR